MPLEILLHEFGFPWFGQEPPHRQRPTPPPLVGKITIFASLTMRGSHVPGGLPSSRINAGFPSASSITLSLSGVLLVRIAETRRTPLLVLVKSVTRKSTVPGTVWGKSGRTNNRKIRPPANTAAAHFQLLVEVNIARSSGPTRRLRQAGPVVSDCQPVSDPGLACSRMVRHPVHASMGLWPGWRCFTPSGQ